MLKILFFSSLSTPNQFPKVTALLRGSVFGKVICGWAGRDRWHGTIESTKELQFHLGCCALVAFVFHPVKFRVFRVTLHGRSLCRAISARAANLWWPANIAFPISGVRLASIMHVTLPVMKGCRKSNFISSDFHAIPTALTRRSWRPARQTFPIVRRSQLRWMTSLLLKSGAFRDCLPTAFKLPERGTLKLTLTLNSIVSAINEISRMRLFHSGKWGVLACSNSIHCTGLQNHWPAKSTNAW